MMKKKIITLLIIVIGALVAWKLFLRNLVNGGIPLTAKEIDLLRQKYGAWEDGGKEDKDGVWNALQALTGLNDNEISPVWNATLRLFKGLNIKPTGYLVETEFSDFLPGYIQKNAGKGPETIALGAIASPFDIPLI